MRSEKLLSDRAESLCDKVGYFKYLDLALLAIIIFICGIFSGYIYYRHQLIQLIQLGF